MPNVTNYLTSCIILIYFLHYPGTINFEIKNFISNSIVVASPEIEPKLHFFCAVIFEKTKRAYY